MVLPHSSAMAAPAAAPAACLAPTPLAAGSPRCRGRRTGRRAGQARCATVGIDLGTTTSAVGVVRDGRPCIAPVDGGRLTLPSVVHFPEVRACRLARARLALLHGRAKHRAACDVQRILRLRRAGLSRS